MRVRLRRLRAPVGAMLAVALLGVLALAGPNADAASPPNPAQFDATTTFSLSNTTPGAVADSTSTIVVPSGDLNLGGGSGHVPPQATLHPAANEPALGDIVGTSSSSTYLGLSNLACASNFGNDFVLMNAVANDSAGTIDVDLNPPAGGQGKLVPLMADNGAGADGTPGAQSPVNELPGQVDRYPTFLETLFPGLFPSFRYAGGLIISNTAITINVLMFAPGALSVYTAPDPLSDLAPTRMGYATQIVLGDPTTPPAPSTITAFCTPITNTAVLFGNTRDNPCLVSLNCTTTGQVNTPCPVSGAGNCASLAPTARIRYQNPTLPGTRFFLGVQYSQRDSDGDGLENGFDTCPDVATPAFDPRLLGGDAANDTDLDAIPNLCDPTPGVNTGGGNHDGDTFTNGDPWLNDSDNCPLVANGDQAETEISEPDNVARPRGGTHSDGMGDACDEAESGGQCGNAVDDDADGLVNDGCPTVGSFAEPGCLNTVDDADEDVSTAGVQGDDTVVNDGCPSSARVATGTWYATLSLTPVCFGNTDADGDGYCSTVTQTDGFYPFVVPADPSDSNASLTPEAYWLFFPLPVIASGAGAGAASGEPVQVCNDGIDNDGNGKTDLLDLAFNKCRPPYPLGYVTTDTDGDGYLDEAEILIGTDPLGRCEVSTAATQPGTGPGSASTDWPPDLVGGVLSFDKAQIGDLSSYVAPVYRLGTNPGNPNFDRRWDIVPGPGVLATWINIADLANLTTVAPPMFGGATKALSGPWCTAHPVLGD